MVFQFVSGQGGRCWQPFSERKNGHTNFHQVRICYFRDKCVVFARNCKFANIIQYNMQYIPCNSALLAQETTVFNPTQNFFCPKSSKKCVNWNKSFYRDKIEYVRAYNFSPSPKFSANALRAFAQLLGLVLIFVEIPLVAVVEWWFCKNWLIRKLIFLRTKSNLYGVKVFGLRAVSADSKG